MAVETITVGTAKSRVSQLVFNQDTPPTGYGTKVARALNQALVILFTEAESMFHAEATLATVVGQTDYLLYGGVLDNFFRFIEPGAIRMRTSPFTVLQPAMMQDWVKNGWFRTTGNSEPTNYVTPFVDIATGATTLRLYPPPATVRTLDLRIITSPANIETAADNTVIDRRIKAAFHDALIFGAASLMSDLVTSDVQRASYAETWKEKLRAARAQSNSILGLVRQRERYDASSTYVQNQSSVSGTQII